MKNKNREYITGLIIFIAMIVFFGGILWLSGKNLLFSDDYRYYFEFTDVVGLQDQSPVFIRGYRVGWTKEVNFKGDLIHIGVDIKKKYTIPVDSKVEITTLNFIGEKAITIMPGTSNLNLKPGSILQGENKDLMTLAQKILFTAKTKLEAGDLNQLIDKINESIEAAHTLIKRMSNEIDKLNISMYNQQIERLGLAGKELKEFLFSAQNNTERLTQVGEESMEKFNQTLGRVDETLGHLYVLSTEVREITENINEGGGTLSEFIKNKQFFENLNQTIIELNAFLADIKKNPKKYVKFSIF